MGKMKQNVAFPSLQLYYNLASFAGSAHGSIGEEVRRNTWCSMCGTSIHGSVLCIIRRLSNRIMSPASPARTNSPGEYHYAKTQSTRYRFWRIDDGCKMIRTDMLQHHLTRRSGLHDLLQQNSTRLFAHTGVTLKAHWDCPDPWSTTDRMATHGRASER